MPETAEIAPDLFRISVFAPEINLQFNHFLIRDEQPMLFHRNAAHPALLRSISSMGSLRAAGAFQPHRRRSGRLAPDASEPLRRLHALHAQYRSSPRRIGTIAAKYSGGDA